MVARMAVSARHVYRMVRVARDLGVPIPSAKVAPDRLDRPPDPRDRIDVDVACELVEWLQDELGVVDLGLRVAEAQDTQWLDPASLLVAVSATLREGLRRAETYWPIWASRRCHFFVPTSGGAEWRFTPPPDMPWRSARVAFEEFTMTEVAMGLSQIAGRRLRPLSVHFRHAPTPSAERMEALFGCGVTFESDRASLELASEDLVAPIPGANPLLAEYLEVQCRELVAQLDALEPMSQRTRQVLRRELGRSELTVATVAQRLATSTRALQRALADERTTFSALLEEERRALACDALARGEPVERVSERVGFRDARSFRRAFRRWTGVTPQRWRRGASSGRPVLHP